MKTKLYILTGFLGSGKTTLLMGILKALEGKRVGVLQNEFGKVNIDGALLRDEGISMREISRGSIFCSCLKLSFVKALQEMAAEGFDYLFVESSGLGDPSNVEEILGAVDEVAKDAYEFCGVICLVDAVNFTHDLGELETVERQLRHCNMAVMSKVDLVSFEDISALQEEIRKINPVCAIVPASKGEMDMSFLNEDLLQLEWATAEETTNTPETKPKTLFMNLNEACREEELENFLKAVLPSCYRIKGFADLEGKGRVQVDGVGEHVLFTPSDKEDPAQLVFISKVGPLLIKKILESWKELCTTEMKLKN